jgi:hypothetical protein
MIELPNGKCPPTRMDQLAKGVDCARHPLLGCIIAQNGTPPEEQARNFLRSLRSATVHQVAGRAGDLSDAEFKDLWSRLEQWEANGGKVELPPPARGV